MLALKTIAFALICYCVLVESVNQRNEWGLEAACPPRHVLACMPDNELSPRSTGMGLRDNVEFKKLLHEFCDSHGDHDDSICEELLRILVCENEALRLCPELVSEWISKHVSSYMKSIRDVSPNCRFDLHVMGCKLSYESDLTNGEY